MSLEPIHDVLSALLILLGIEDTSWQSMKKFRTQCYARNSKTLDKAQGPLGQSGGEQKRWSEQVEELLKALPAKMLLSDRFYNLFRANLRRYTEICSRVYNGLMSTESELLTWKALGLPLYNLSKENALVV